MDPEISGLTQVLTFISSTRTRHWNVVPNSPLRRCAAADSLFPASMDFLAIVMDGPKPSPFLNNAFVVSPRDAINAYR